MAALGRPFCLENADAGPSSQARAGPRGRIRACRFVVVYKQSGPAAATDMRGPTTLIPRKFPPHPNQRRHPMTFQNGESGNPAGRARGSRNKRTLLAEHLLEGDTEAIVRSMIERAKEGDMAAVRLCVDRICPRLTDRPARLDLPPPPRAPDAPPARRAGA